MRLTIGKKLGFGFGLIIALIATCAAVAFVQLSTMDLRLNEAFDQALPATKASQTALTGIARVRGAMRGVMLWTLTGNHGDEQKEALKQRDANWEVVDGAVNELASRSNSTAGLEIRHDIDRITSLIDDMKDIQRNIDGLTTAAAKQAVTEDKAQSEDLSTIVSTWETEFRPRAGELTTLLENIAAAADKKLAAARADVSAANDLVNISLIVATAIAIVIGSIVAFLLSRKISLSMRTLADRAQQISTGNLTGENLLLKSSDELGALAGGFNVMLGSLKDLTKQILTVTENVNSATTQIASSTKQQASSTKEQAATVQQITTTMKELSQSGAQIVEKAKEVAEAAESASESSRFGIDAVLGTNRTMESIREQVEEVAQNIVALSEKTQAVGEIIATVNDIAEQSNLLALNASIEAADAGDEGNRFSVVANEMKNLADQAKGCTVQVRGILGEIQKGINTAVMLTEEAVKRVDSGKQQADVSERTIREMIASTQASVQAYQQIIGATNQQQIGYEQVSKGMFDIDAAARQTATSTSQLEQALVSLSAMSHQLKTAVSAYRI